MVLNEVYTGAGLSATMIPEADFEISQAFGTEQEDVSGLYLLLNSSSKDTLTWSLTNDTRLVVDIYKGCMATLTAYTNVDGLIVSGSEVTLMIKTNTANTIVFNQNLHSVLGVENTSGYGFTCKILSYGAPVYAPTPTASKVTLLSDNWLGLVNTISPPTVDAEMKQVNLALGGTRNFGFQFKGAETLGEASIDVSLNNGSWLYYTLGNLNSLTTTGQGTNTLNALSEQSGKAFAQSGITKIYRVEEGSLGNEKILPTPTAAVSTDLANYDEIDADTVLTYGFTENNTGDLPSFALEVTNQKGSLTTLETDAAPSSSVFTRIFTGCQVQSLALNFEEGQEVKATIGAVARKAHDSAAAYLPKRATTSPTDLFNYNSTANNNPYMFSDGSLKIYGQTFARVKSGTLTISNNLTPQRFIGQYDKTITSAHIAGQRTYELTMNLLITDMTVWTELRNQNETDNTVGLIELVFAKDGSASDKITIKLDDYLTQSVDIPFPEDKGPLEVSVTISARTLNSCEYVGRHVIQI